MPSFHVRFKGMLTGQERERLAAAEIRLQGSRPSMITGNPETGTVRTGRPIYTVSLNASSSQEALLRGQRGDRTRHRQLLELGS